MLLTLALLCSIQPRLAAQQAPLAIVAGTELPDAPDSEALAQSSGPSANGADPAAPHSPGNVFGTVLDSSGAVVPGARVALIGKAGTELKVVMSGSLGEFAFNDLPAGTYHVTIASVGMGTFISPAVTIGAGERREVPRISLAVASNRADVLVTVTEQELATEQVHQELQQRVFGIVPNFYSSYDPNPVPLSAKQKFQLAIRSTTDPVSFATAGISAGIGQATDLYSGYGQGAEGYAKRYGAAFADDIIDRVLGSAVLPTLFHQDPRYFYKGTGTRKERAIYAVKSAFICKGDNGKWQFNYSHLIGNFAAAGISNAYYPAGDRGAGLTLRNGAVDTAGNAIANLTREFLLKGLTPKAPKDPKP